MPGTRKRRNSPLACLRQTITSLPIDTDNASLVLYLTALMVIMRNNRLRHLVGKTNIPNNLSASDLQQLTKDVYSQLSSFAGKLTHHLPLPDHRDEIWKTTWQSLQNKKLETLWGDETTLGYTYQFLCSPRRQQSVSNLSQSDKTIDAQTLIDFTQLYTPDWVADYLLNSTIMPLWNEKLSVAKITVVDPASGAGNFLVKAFDLLSKLYIQEGATEKEAGKLLLKQNLFGADIDEKALAVSALALMVRSLKTNTVDSQSVNLQLATGTDPKNMLGSLNRHWPADHILSKQYRVVVTNPPYIGRKLLDRSLKQALKVEYPNSHNDLANAFLERCLELAEPSGMVGVITQSSILSLPSYSKLRKSLLEKTTIDTCVELGPGVFPLKGGEKINSLLLILKNSPLKGKSRQARFIDLTETKDKSAGLANPGMQNVYEIPQGTLANNSNCVFNYRCPTIITTLIGKAKTLSNLAEVRQGLATTDNNRFVRYWWDVDSDDIGKRWFPYAKGAGIRRWHNPIRHLVNWQNEGQEIKEAVTSAYPYLNGKSAWVVKNEKYYFRQGLTFSFIGGQDLAVRYLPSGCIFDVAGSAIFVADESLFCYLSYLNSSFIRAVACTLNPSINFQVGDLKKLPVLDFLESEKQELAQTAKECFSIKEWLDNFDPTIFASTPDELLNVIQGKPIEKAWKLYSDNYQQKTNRLMDLEDRLNHIVMAAVSRQWGLDATDSKTLTDWINRISPTGNASTEALDSTAFAKTVLYHMVSQFLKNNIHLTFAIGDDIDDKFSTSKENIDWISQQLKQPINKYLTEKFTIEHAKQFGGSPNLICQPIKGNGHAVLFSTQTVRLMQKKNLGNETMPMLSELAEKLLPVRDWTGKQLLSHL